MRWFLLASHILRRIRKNMTVFIGIPQSRRWLKIVVLNAQHARTVYLRHRVEYGVLISSLIPLFLLKRIKSTSTDRALKALTFGTLWCDDVFFSDCPVSIADGFIYNPRGLNPAAVSYTHLVKKTFCNLLIFGCFIFCFLLCTLR